MKIKSIKYILLVSLSFITFFSCTNDSGELVIENQEQFKVSDNAFVSELGDQEIQGTINLQMVHPAGKSTIDYNHSILLPFYKLSIDNNYDWISIPSIQKEKNIKIYFSRQNDSELTIKIEKLKGSEPIEKTIELKSLNVVTVKASALKGLSRSDLDLRDYNQVLEYFSLK